MLRGLVNTLPKLVAVSIILAGFASPNSCQAQNTEDMEALQEAYEIPQATPEMYQESQASEGSDGALAANLTRLTWQHDLRTSLSMAKRSQKLVLVDVYTSWCGWCKRLDRDVYANPNIARFVDSQFVPVKINAEDNGEGAAFAKKLEIRGYPCTVVLDSDGHVKGLFYGYRKPNEFPAELAKAAGIQPNTQM